MIAQLSKAAPNAIIVDDFLANPDEVRKFALAQPFQENPSLHKGQRTKERFLWPGMKERLSSLIGRKITRWEEHGFNGVFQLTVASDQLVYHSDHQTFAGAIYLAPDAPPEAGTSLWRSKATKGRTVEESLKTMAYRPAFAPPGHLSSPARSQVEHMMYKDKLLDRTAWELVDSIGNWYNRLVVWNGKLVHSASQYFGTNKENGRLVQLFFFDAEL